MRWPKKKYKQSVRRPQSSGAAPVFSYYTSRSKPDQQLDRGKQDQRTTKTRGFIRQRLSWRRLPLTLAVTAIATSLCYSLSLNNTPRIVVISPGEGPTLLQDLHTYQNSGSEVLKQSFLNYTKLTVDTLRVARDLRSRHPELAEVVMTIPIAGRRPVIQIQPAKPTLTILSVQAKSFVIDEQGRAVVESKHVVDQKVLDLPIIRDESGLDIKIGSYVLPREDVQFVQDLLFQLNAKNVQISELTLPQVANELHIRLKDQSYYVKFNTAGDPRAQAGSFLAVRRRLEADGKLPAEYIDVRLEDKAFYK